MECVNCGYAGEEFRLEVVGSDKGAFVYGAKCPVCGSAMVRHTSGYHEEGLRLVCRTEPALAG